MNAHVTFKTDEPFNAQAMVARHIVRQQADQSWMDSVGGCDDCSTIPFDVVAAGRTRSVAVENDQLVMREDRFGSILG